MPLAWQDLVERPIVGCSLPDCEAVCDCLLDGEPYCFDCAEAVLERSEAVAVNPRMRSLLPDLVAWGEG